MLGSCRGSALEGDLSRSLQTVSEVERLYGPWSRFREVGEAPVAAVELRALVRLLDRERAARQRLTRQLQAAVALSALRLLEQLHVDLGCEHLVRAAHVSPLRERVVVRVQARATRLDAARRSDHAIAVRQALATL